MNDARQRFLWDKKGLIFVPDGRYEWMQSYAQNPSVLILGDRLRIYFTCRPNRDSTGNFASLTTFVDVDKRNPGDILRVHDRPVIPLGGLGAFDQFGVMPGSVLRVADEVWLYYVGWSRCLGVPYNHAIGLAISRDGGTVFQRLGEGPIIGQSLKEPFIQNSPFVTRYEDTYHMWYSTGTRWIENDGRKESIYVIVHATSADGIEWRREATPCIPFRVADECQTNPSVIECEGRYHMWFCYRWGVDFRNAERGYRIGYAWSSDLQTWHRDDEIGALGPSGEGWDAQMVCYPRVVRTDGTTYMFYSGNYFGRDGFGYAELKLRSL